MELGRVREQVGDVDGGERALRRSVEFAPHYAMPRWYLGNLLLRAGRQDEAFAELRRASEADPTLRPQIFATLWSLFGGDVERVSAAVGDSAAGRAQLVEYLVRLKRMDEALRLWSSLGERERREQRATGEMLRGGLLEAGRIRGAVEVHRTVAPEGAAEVSVGNVINGGFESEVGASNKHPFIWDVRPVAQTQMGLDVREPHGGSRSLRITFDAPTALAFANVSQLVPVESRARYRLEYFVRTENLKTATSLVVQVLDNGDAARPLATSPPVADGTNGWQRVALEFTATPQTEAVLLRIVRPSCTEEACPIFGKVWYDDFNLPRIGGDAAGARAANAGDVGARREASGER
jgi:tetratricopeptide (TPR) repeat protein